MIFTGIPYAFMMSQRLGRCGESKAFSKSIALRTRGVCHSYDCYNNVAQEEYLLCGASSLPESCALVLLLASYQLLSSNAQ